jgi:hypothetical protein
VSESVKASRATVTLGSIIIDGFVLPNGEYRMSQTQMAETVAKPEINARRFLESRFPDKSFELFDVYKTDLKRGATRISAVSFNQAIEYWQHQARMGNAKASNLLAQISKNPPLELEGYRGICVVAPLKQRRKKEQDYERWYVHKLQVQIGGIAEVLTPAGSIDLLTSTQLIEFKCVKNWKAAIGQVLVYSAYYPSHERRIHLFGNCQNSLLDVITAHCQSHNILMTWENDCIKTPDDK